MLLHHVIAKQFETLRDGDRFWHQRAFVGEELARIETTRLSDVIRRNTSLRQVQTNVFFVADASPALASGF